MAISLNPGFDQLRGIILGRFQDESALNEETMRTLVGSLPSRFRRFPILGHFDFGHTQPILTLPIGGTVRIEVGETSRVHVLMRG